MKELVIDIETQNIFGPRRDTKELKVSIVGTFDYHDNQFFVYEENVLDRLWKKMEDAERVIGYNINGFDLPVLNNYYKGNLLKLKVLDLMDEVTKVLGFRVKLDSLAEATLGTKKSGDGLQAVKFWQEGRVEELKKYCLDDVAITRDLYEFGKKNKHLKVYDRFLGKIREIPVNFDLPVAEVKPINLSLF